MDYIGWDKGNKVQFNLIIKSLIIVKKPFTGFLNSFRRNWKRRWFVLKDNVLTYHESDQEGSKSLGTIDIRNAVYVDILTGSYLDLSVA